jgi:MEMO1 family protein
MTTQSVRATTVDGLFYPADPLELAATVKSLLGAATNEPDGASAVLAPHAAFDYAGPTIAAAMLAPSNRQIKRVVVLAPIHRDPPSGFVLPESRAYECPLGEVEIDREMVEEILGCGTMFVRNDIPHLEEHSVEVLLPFIRYLYPEARLVPILTGDSGKKAIVALARGMEVCLGGESARTLFVVSANIASTFPRGPGTPEAADRLLELLAARRWEDIMDLSDRGDLSCCGSRALASMLAYGTIATDARVLARSSSSDETGKRMVHYAAVSFRAGR